MGSNSKALLEQYFPVPTITPGIGVTAFLKQFGTIARVRGILTEMNIKASLLDVQKWKRENKLPRFIYEALKAVGIETRENTASGPKFSALEIYFEGKFLGRLELPRNVEVVLKNRRHT